MTGSRHAEDLLKMDSTTDFSRYPTAGCLSGKEPHLLRYVLKHKANCFSIKALHHRCLYSKAHDKIFFSIIQHTCNTFFFSWQTKVFNLKYLANLNSSYMLTIHSNNLSYIRLSESDLSHIKSILTHEYQHNST